MLLQHQSLQIVADYHQFYLWDRGMEPVAPIDYTEIDIERRIKTGPNVVVIQPARSLKVPVDIFIYDSDPGFDDSEWDHVAEASLHLPTGQLEVHECMGGPVAEFKVRPGWYRVRGFFGSLEDIDNWGIEGNDHYRADLWPKTSGDLLVIKQAKSHRV